MRMKLHFRLNGLMILTFFMLKGEVNAEAEYLSDGDKKKLQEKLETLLNSAESSSKQRFARALTAFKSAIQSDVAAHELYLECYEKVNYIDKQRSSQEFREWKRKHRERDDLSDFRRALRHQLNWLLLSIQVSVNPDEIHEYGGEAVNKVDQIMDELKILKSQQSVLNQKVLSSVYARAYDINGLEADNWPLSPTDISGIYDKVIMPPIRERGEVNTLRASWDKRIKHIGLIKKEWSKQAKTGKISVKKNIGSPEYEKWLNDGYLKLIWRKEKDLFKIGDEVRASDNMLSLISNNINNKLSLQWVEDFQSTTGIIKDDEANTGETTQK